TEIKVGLPLSILTIVTLPIGTTVKAIEPKLERSDCFLDYVVSLVKTIRSANLLGVEAPRRIRRRMPHHKVNRRRGLGSVEKAASTPDFLDLAYTLRDGQIVERRKADPVTRQGQTIHERRDKFGLLRITKTAIAEIELAGCVLFCD